MKRCRLEVDRYRWTARARLKLKVVSREYRRKREFVRQNVYSKVKKIVLKYQLF